MLLHDIRYKHVAMEIHVQKLSYLQLVDIPVSQIRT